MILSGVYEIKNILNGHRYIGSSININGRLQDHKKVLRKCQHGNFHLQSAFNKYGKENFVFNPLLYCDCEMTLAYEQRCLDGLKPEYNIARDAQAPMRGRSHTEETRKKMRDNHVGRTGQKCTEETKRKISQAQIGRVLSEECKQHIREGMTKEVREKINITRKGYVHSVETRHKMALARVGGKPFLGFHHSEDSKAKISTGGLGRIVSKEVRAKISQAMKGQQNMLGHKHSKETKQKMRDAWLIRHAKEK